MKKNYIPKSLQPCLLLLFMITGITSWGQVGIGTTNPDASAALDIFTTTSGLLPPRLTTAQRNVIANPAKGLLIFNLTTNAQEVNTGTPASPVWTSTSVGPIGPPGPQGPPGSNATVTSITPIAVNNGVVSLTDGGVTSAKILDFGVATIDIANNAVNSAKIADGTIVNVDLAAGVGGIYKGSGSLAVATTVTQGTNTLAFNSSALNGFSVDGTTFSVDASNNRVGIGTVAPTEKLHVIGNITAIGTVTAANAVNSGEWFRNTVASAGLYNNPLGNHFAAVSDADWRITGDAASCGLGFGSSNFSTIYGYAYGDGAGIGFLSPGRGWAIRWLNNDTQFTGNISASGSILSLGGFSPPNGAIRLTPNLHLNSGTGSAIYVNWDSGAGVATNPAFVVANGTSSELMRVNYNGNITSFGTMTAPGFFQSSDARLKDIIKRDGDVAYYTWKDGRDKMMHIGYIAQEVQAKNPEQVNTDQYGKLSVNYIEVLVEKIRTLEKEIELLKAKK
jgi:hypothetical protein